MKPRRVGINEDYHEVMERVVACTDGAEFWVELRHEDRDTMSVLSLKRAGLSETNWNKAPELLKGEEDWDRVLELLGLR